MSTEITDNSQMPFGLHKGKAMVNVPAVYLIAIFDKGWIVHEGVKRYVLDNMQALRQEASKSKRR